MGKHSQDIDGINNNEFICGVVEGFYGKPWTFNQRHDLFKKLKDLKLNSYMYAPKDDSKHRAKWRELYSDNEAQDIKSLIEEAKINGIDFYYSLAPGLDIVYSDQEEIDILLRKFDQLVELGCQCFAILFDDIEPTMTNEKDTRVFKNYASAQVSITNLVYDHLNKPKFLFCPTEYCESRTVPDLANSQYLNTIGLGLGEAIDIMWTGKRVIPRVITEESIEQLTKVIRRPPVIWENLHANDYDKRRIFLGPFSGRSTNIIPKLRGVLTNPNCEYEANHVAIHTLAQWSYSKQDINQHNRCNLKSKTCYDLSCLDDSSFDPSVYDPDRALCLALKDWLPKVFGETADIMNVVDLSKIVELFFLPFEHGTYGSKLLDDIRWLKDNSKIIIESSPASDHKSCERVPNKSSNINDDDDQSIDSVDLIDIKTPDSWHDRADNLNMQCATIIRLVDTLIGKSINKALVEELKPYMMDLKESMGLLLEYIKFLRCRNSTQEDFNDQKKFFSKQIPKDPPSNEPEPWALRGGLMGDICRIIF